MLFLTQLTTIQPKLITHIETTVKIRNQPYSRRGSVGPAGRINPFEGAVPLSLRFLAAFQRRNSLFWRAFRAGSRHEQGSAAQKEKTVRRPATDT